MKELLLEQLKDYLHQKKEIDANCIRLMKEGKEWKDEAQKGLELYHLIEVLLIEYKNIS